MSFAPRLLIAWGINLLALWAADGIWDGVTINGWTSYLLGSAVLGVANAVLKPLLTVLTLPLIIVTLGLFYLAINITMVALAEWVAPHFSIDGFWTYVGTVVVIWAVNWVGDQVLSDAGRRARPRLI
jgi:putative membrane protein